MVSGTTTAGNSGGLATIISTNPTQSSDCQSGVQDFHSTCLSYDSHDRLQVVSVPNAPLTSTTTISMTYNTAGQRASYTVTPHGASSPSLTELFTYRGGQVGQVAFSGTSLTTPYTDTYLYRQDGAPYELIRVSNGSGPCGASTCKYWYAVDGRGNVVALTDGSGNVVDRYHYDVWGVPTIDLETVQQPLLYAGYWYDRELQASGETSGWYWLSVRPYDPTIKRFPQPDPSMQDGVRSYVYVGDDPVDGTDPSGLITCAKGQHEIGTRGGPICVANDPGSGTKTPNVNWCNLWVIGSILCPDKKRQRAFDLYMAHLGLGGAVFYRASNSPDPRKALQPTDFDEMAFNRGQTRYGLSVADSPSRGFFQKLLSRNPYVFGIPEEGLTQAGLKAVRRGQEGHYEIETVSGVRPTLDEYRAALAKVQDVFPVTLVPDEEQHEP